MKKDYSEIQEAANLFGRLIKLKESKAERPKPDRKSRLVKVLAELCGDAGFTDALLLDSEGFVMAAEGPSREDDGLAALAMVLAGALEKISDMPGQDEANHVCVQPDASRKITLTRFSLEQRPFFLLTTGPPQTEARESVEFSLHQLQMILAEP